MTNATLTIELYEAVGNTQNQRAGDTSPSLPTDYEPLPRAQPESPFPTSLVPIPVIIMGPNSQQVAVIDPGMAAAAVFGGIASAATARLHTGGPGVKM